MPDDDGLFHVRVMASDTVPAPSAERALAKVVRRLEMAGFRVRTEHGAGDVREVGTDAVDW